MQRDARNRGLARARTRQVLIHVCAAVAVTLTLFLSIEGFASLVLTINEARKDIVLSRLLHTRHDVTLGWAPEPNVYLPDAYGKGISIRTNSKGFRNNQEFPVAKPAGKLRMICSGDSFTFGMGVDNDNTWCQQLANRDSRLETINMGQIAYGIDQSYLLYLRDGAALEQDVHIFAFIARDLPRMAKPEFLGYGKPTLEIENGKLVVKDTPVPRFMMKRRLKELLTLRSVQLLQRVQERLRPGNPAGDPGDEVKTRQLTLKVLEELAALHQQHGRLFFAVYLPWAEDYGADPLQEERREYLRREISRRGIAYLDVAEPFRKLDRHEMEDLFIIEKAHWPSVGVWGHYSIKGNDFVASQVSRFLSENPTFATKLRQEPLLKRGPGLSAAVATSRVSTH